MSQTFIVRSKSGCPHCVFVKEELAKAGHEYVEEIYDDFDERQRMYDKLGLEGAARTVPQVTKITVSPTGRKHEYIGGAMATSKHLAEQKESFF